MGTEKLLAFSFSYGVVSVFFFLQLQAASIRLLVSSPWTANLPNLYEATAGKGRLIDLFFQVELILSFIYRMLCGCPTAIVTCKLPNMSSFLTCFCSFLLLSLLTQLSGKVATNSFLIFIAFHSTKIHLVGQV